MWSTLCNESILHQSDYVDQVERNNMKIDCLLVFVVNTYNSFICHKYVVITTSSYSGIAIKLWNKNTNTLKTHRFTTFPSLTFSSKDSTHYANPKQIQGLTTTDRSWLMSDFWGLSEMDLLNAFSGRFPFSASKLRRFLAISPSFSFSVSRLDNHALFPSTYFRFGMGNELILSSNEGVVGSADWVRYEDEDEGW